MQVGLKVGGSRLRGLFAPAYGAIPRRQERIGVGVGVVGHVWAPMGWAGALNYFRNKVLQAGVEPPVHEKHGTER